MDPIAFDVVRTTAGLDDLAADWRALEESAATPLQLFQTHAWNRAWWSHFGAEPRHRLAVLAGRRDGELVLVWPMVQRRMGPLRILEQTGGLLSCYDDALIADTVDVTAGLEAAWSHLLALDGNDAVVLRDVHEGARIADLAARRAGETIATTTAPFIDLTAASDFDAHLRDRAKKFRKDLRRSWRRLRRLGELEYTSSNDAGMSVGAAVTLALELKRSWLHARGLSGKTMFSARGQQYLSDVFARLPSESSARPRISTLRLDGRVIAIGIGVDFMGRHYEYLGAFDYRYESYGPGRAQMSAGIEAAMSDGCEVFDLLTPATDFKMRWTHDAAQVRRYVVACNWRGRLFRNAYLRGARPVLKRLYTSIGPRLRRRTPV